MLPECTSLSVADSFEKEKQLEKRTRAKADPFSSEPRVIRLCPEILMHFLIRNGYAAHNAAAVAESGVPVRDVPDGVAAEGFG